MNDQLPDSYLRLEGIKGQSTDVMHPGDNAVIIGAEEKQDGWLSIKSFSFTVSFDRNRASQMTLSGATGSGGRPGQPQDQARQIAQLQESNRAIAAQLQARDRAAAAPRATPGRDAPPALPTFSFSKNVDVASDDLLRKCASGEVIPLAVFETCRYGGQGTQYKDIKIPFFRATFKEVVVKEVKINPSSEPLPEEDVECHYKTLQIETIWTDNETGARRSSSPNRAGWNFQTNELVVE